MPRARIRRPLLALIVLVIALAIGYTVRAVHDRSDGGTPAPTPSVSVSVSVSVSR